MDYEMRCIRTNVDEVLFETFHNETSLSQVNSHLFEESISSAFDNPFFMDRIHKKEIVDDVCGIKLRSNTDKNNVLLNTIHTRESIREFSCEEITLESFSNILVHSYGKSESGSYTIPSAGGAYPLTLILIIKNVKGILKGIYESLPQNNTIKLIGSEESIEVNKITLNEYFFETCAFSVHLIGDPKLICYKYQDRGYRFMNIECGHLAQNLNLVAQYYGVASVCSGGFLDGEFIDYLNNITNGNYHNYVNLYEVFFGKKQE